MRSSPRRPSILGGLAPALVAVGLAASPAAAQYLYIANFHSGGSQAEVLRFSAATGAFVDHLVPPDSSPLHYPERLAIGPDGKLYVSGGAGILRFDVRTGQFLDVFRPEPTLAFTFGPDGNLLAPVTTAAGVVLRRYELASGAPAGDLVGAPSAILDPLDLQFGPDGDLYVIDAISGEVRQYDGASGASQGAFIPAVSGDQPLSLLFAPSGALYVAEFSGVVRRYDARTGVAVATLHPPGPPGSFYSKFLALGPDGSLYVADAFGSGVLRFSGVTNAYSSTLVAAGAGGAFITRGLAFGPCSTGLGSLCLESSRFRVTARWRTREGKTGLGTPIALSGDTGYFWFFGPANLELVVKVLNGCAVNQRHWVFAGGLTDVAVTVTVTDTSTGATRAYDNPPGTAFQPIQDTAAFTDCP